MELNVTELAYFHIFRGWHIFEGLYDVVRDNFGWRRKSVVVAIHLKD